MIQADVIVIGGGVCGLGAAYFLSQTRRVVLLEQESQPAYHSSGRSAALYIIGYESPEVSALTAAGRRFFDDPPDEFDTRPLLSPRGGLTLAEPGSEDQLGRYLARWQPHCPNLSAISSAEARERVPILRPERIAAAAFDPDWYSIDVHALVMGYRRGVIRQGSSFTCNARVSAIRRSGNGWRVEAGETYSAPLVVNAAGAWASHIGDLAGLHGVPLQPLRRTAVLLPLPTDGATWPSVHTLKEDLYFKPEGNGLMLSPEDETPSAPCDAAPDEVDVARTIDHFERLTNEPVVKLQSKWAGLRTFAPDRRPVIGPDPREPAFIWYAGLGGFGVQTSPALARIVARCVTHRGDQSGEVDTAIAASRLIAAVG